MKKWEDLPETMQNSSVRRYYDILEQKKVSLFFKRIFDIVFSIIGLIVFLPIIIITSIAIKIDSKGPIFYKQERITRYNKPFYIYKFRTMIRNADKIGALVTEKNDRRITRIGKIIRKIRLDEVPQLINVLKGDMSFVGTRPEVKKYVNKYTNEMKATLLIRAGITSETSIKYKDEDEIINKYSSKNNNIDEIYIKKVLPQKMNLNLKYIENMSIANDLRIIAKTILAVLRPGNKNTQVAEI